MGLAADTLAKYGLRDALYILGEDGTSCLKRIDVELVRVDDEWRIRCYGLACGPFDLRQGDAIEKLHQLAKEHGLATTFYVLSLIPLVKGASAAARCKTLSPSSPLCRWDLLEREGACPCSPRVGTGRDVIVPLGESVARRTA